VLPELPHRAAWACSETWLGAHPKIKAADTFASMVSDDARVRCGWCGTDPDYVDYHELEWGVPVHDDRKLFELVILEGAQSGLSWSTILHKREGYRRAFAGFDAERVARFGAREVRALMKNPGIVRNRAKIEAAIDNARALLAVQETFGSFAFFQWRLVGGRTRQNAWRTLKELPAETADSRALAREMKARGFRFFGPVVAYAHMQAAGMVNDHLVACFRHAELGGVAPSKRRSLPPLKQFQFRRGFLVREGPAKQRGDRACPKKLCLTSTRAEPLARILYELSLRDDCYFVKLDRKPGPHGMLRGRCFLSDERAVAIAWLRLKQTEDVLCTIQDDEFTAPLRAPPLSAAPAARRPR
jgi:DNA-3-methyladenine glycosylase I